MLGVYWCPLDSWPSKCTGRGAGAASSGHVVSYSRLRRSAETAPALPVSLSIPLGARAAEIT